MCFSVKVDRDAQRVANRFNAKRSEKFEREFQELKSANPKQYKEVGEDGRLYPNIFTNVITMEEGKRLLRPMRYRVRPAGSSSEVPSKFNVFNARMDSLDKRQTWRTLIGRKHCLLPFESFYEWVERDGKKVLINFRPENRDGMWAPGLYDTWISPDGKEIIHSFAIITTEPPREIEEMGHDRCPIFLKQDYIDDWLRPDGLYFDELLAILEQKEEAYFGNSLVV